MTHLVLGVAVEVGALVAARAAELRDLGWHTLLALAAAQADDLARRGELRGIAQAVVSMGDSAVTSAGQSQQIIGDVVAGISNPTNIGTELPTPRDGARVSNRCSDRSGPGRRSTP